jgi:hypothetical protein
MFSTMARGRAVGRTAGLCVAIAGCTGPIRSIAPTNLAPIPADSASAWAAPFRPTVPLLFELRWRFENREGTAAGRATARYAPPDTLRFDYRGPFGRSGSALVVGDEAVWSAPEGDVDDLVPVAPVLWAALGIVRPAPDGSQVLGSATTERHAWRYATGGRVVDYIRVMGARPRLLAELREADRILGVVETVLDSAGAVRPVASETAYPPGTWNRP